MTSYKAKVKAVHPAAVCVKTGLGYGWVVYEWAKDRGPVVFGDGKTAFLAWVDAWRNIEKERGGK